MSINLIKEEPQFAFVGQLVSITFFRLSNEPCSRTETRPYPFPATPTSHPEQ